MACRVEHGKGYTAIVCGTDSKPNPELEAAVDVAREQIIAEIEAEQDACTHDFKNVANLAKTSKSDRGLEWLRIAVRLNPECLKDTVCIICHLIQEDSKW